MILITQCISEFADDKKSVFFLQTYIGTLEVIIEFKLRRAKRDDWPEGFTDTVTKFLKKLEEMETFAVERCGKNYSRVRNGLFDKDNFKANFLSEGFLYFYLYAVGSKLKRVKFSNILR